MTRGRKSKPIPNAPNRIQEVRLARGFTQEYVAEAAGVSGEQVRKWETGENEITLGKLQQVARRLGVLPHTLLKDYDPGRGEEERALLAIFRSLTTSERDYGLKMLRGLNPAHTERRRVAS